MKRLFKGLFTLLAITILIGACALSACAEEGFTGTEDDTFGQSIGSDDTKESVSPEEYANTEIETEGDEGAEYNEARSETNPFESFYTTVLSYASEIFCLVTLIISLLLSYAFKRGLVPAVKGAICTLSGAVGDLRSQAENESVQLKTLSEQTANKMKLLESSLLGVTEKLSALADGLTQLETDKTERARTASVLVSQTEMMYDLLMTSALPAYQKEAIGEKMQKMKEKINEANTASGEAESD